MKLHFVISPSVQKKNQCIQTENTATTLLSSDKSDFTSENRRNTHCLRSTYIQMVSVYNFKLYTEQEHSTNLLSNAENSIEALA
jgi:hypothetical protein